MIRQKILQHSKKNGEVARCGGAPIIDKLTMYTAWELLEKLVWLLIQDSMTSYMQRHKLPTTLIEKRDLYGLLELLTPEDEL